MPSCLCRCAFATKWVMLVVEKMGRLSGLEKIMIFNKKLKKSDFFDLNQIFLI